MNSPEIIIILLIASNLIVSGIMAKLIFFQNEKIKQITSVNQSLKEYADLFDMEKIKKYVENEKLIMAQDTEILRRKVVKETTEKVSKEFSKGVDNILPKKMSLIMNDLVTFNYWFFKEKMNTDGNMYSHVKEMFPNSHKEISEYFKLIDSQKKNSSQKQSEDEKEI